MLHILITYLGTLSEYTLIVRAQGTLPKGDNTANTHSLTILRLGTALRT
jgi:hypothetical protein